MGPRLEGGFCVAAGWRLFTEPRRWPLGRAKPLLKSSLSPAAAGAAMGVDFPLGDEGVSFDVVLDRLQARFPLGADSAPLSASSSTLVRTAERSPSRALTRAPTRPSIQEVARGPRLRDHMLRHECSEIKEALRIAVSAQQGLEAPLHLSRKPQPLAPGHCPTCGFRRPLPPSTKPRLNKSYRGGRDIKSRLATSRAGNRGGLRPPRPLPPE